MRSAQRTGQVAFEVFKVRRDEDPIVCKTPVYSNWFATTDTTTPEITSTVPPLNRLIGGNLLAVLVQTGGTQHLRTHWMRLARLRRRTRRRQAGKGGVCIVVNHFRRVRLIEDSRSAVRNALNSGPAFLGLDRSTSRTAFAFSGWPCSSVWRGAD